MKIAYMPYQASYEIILSSECPFFKEGKSTLRYDIEVKYIKSEGSVFFIEVSKTNVLMNDEEVQDAFNDMLLVTAEALNKVIVRVSESGTVLGLSNFEEIKNKWFDVRNRVEAAYQGDVITNYLNDMQTKLASSEILWNALSKSFFYTVFFNGIYKNYSNNQCLQEEMIIRDLLPTQGVVVLTDQKILVDTEEAVHVLSVKGREAFDGLNQVTKDFFKEYANDKTLSEMCLVEIEGSYTILSATSVINRITMEARVIYDTFYKKSMQIEITKKSN